MKETHTPRGVFLKNIVSELSQRRRNPVEEALFVTKIIGTFTTIAWIRWLAEEPTPHNIVASSIAGGATAGFFIADKIVRGRNSSMNSSEQ